MTSGSSWEPFNSPCGQETQTTVKFLENPGVNRSNSMNLGRGWAHNDANEITAIDMSSTHVAYDDAGNMTRIPRVSGPSSNYRA
jgi:hypothetical protein